MAEHSTDALMLLADKEPGARQEGRDKAAAVDCRSDAPNLNYRTANNYFLHDGS